MPEIFQFAKKNGSYGHLNGGVNLQKFPKIKLAGLSIFFLQKYPFI